MPKKLYRIKVRNMEEDTPAYEMGNRYGVSVDKLFGSMSGGGRPCVDREEVLEYVKDRIKQFPKFDDELNREVEPPTVNNTLLVDESDLELSLGEFFGMTLKGLIN